MRSLGMIEETANTQAGRLDLMPFAPAGSAASFFDVFFEVEVAGVVLHNDQPDRMTAVISHKPPGSGTVYQSAGIVDLMDPNDNPTGLKIISATHIPVP
jgi:hypothetical protein